MYVFHEILSPFGLQNDILYPTNLVGINTIAYYLNTSNPILYCCKDFNYMLTYLSNTILCCVLIYFYEKTHSPKQPIVIARDVTGQASKI